MTYIQTLLELDWLHVLGSTPLEIIATLCSVLGMILVAKQKHWGWAFGLVWAGMSFYLAFFKWSLVSDAVLYASYIPIQIYCWYVWLYRGQPEHNNNRAFMPSWLSGHLQLLLAVSCVIAIAAWGFGLSSLAPRISWLPAPALLWRDSITTVLNYFAQFLQAKKRMENWVLWLIVNVLGIHIYWVKDSPIYSMQYLLALCLGLYGWHQWTKAMKRPIGTPA